MPTISYPMWPWLSWNQTICVMLVLRTVFMHKLTQKYEWERERERDWERRGREGFNSAICNQLSHDLSHTNGLSTSAPPNPLDLSSPLLHPGTSWKRDCNGICLRNSASSGNLGVPLHGVNIFLDGKTQKYSKSQGAARYMDLRSSHVSHVNSTCFCHGIVSFLHFKSTTFFFSNFFRHPLPHSLQK